MPRTSIYVPDDLAEMVRHYGLSVSDVGDFHRWYSGLSRAPDPVAPAA